MSQQHNVSVTSFFDYLKLLSMEAPRRKEGKLKESPLEGLNDEWKKTAEILQHLKTDMSFLEICHSLTSLGGATAGNYIETTIPLDECMSSHAKFKL